MAKFQKVKHGTMHCWSLFLEYYIEEEECGTPLTLINEILSLLVSKSLHFRKEAEKINKPRLPRTQNKGGIPVCRRGSALCILFWLMRHRASAFDSVKEMLMTKKEIMLSKYFLFRFRWSSWNDFLIFLSSSSKGSIITLTMVSMNPNDKKENKNDKKVF